MGERIKWVDVAKGYGILLVIYGHVTTDMFSEWLYTFHMPLFFFLSGFLFNHNTLLKDFLKSKVKGLLLPYITLGIPIYLIYWGAAVNPVMLVNDFLLHQRMSPLWFIIVLFIHFLISYFLYNSINNAIVRWISICLLAFIGISLWHSGIKALLWNVDISLVSLPFFCLGHDMRSKRIFQAIFSKQKCNILITASFAFNLIGFIIIHKMQFPKIDLFWGHFSPEYATYITAFSGIIAMCLIADKWHFRILTYIGKNSLVFFAWQQAIGINCANMLLDTFHLLEQANNVYYLFKNAVIVIISIVILTILNEIVIRTRLKSLIGK